jgi:hypothetical protein
MCAAVRFGALDPLYWFDCWADFWLRSASGEVIVTADAGTAEVVVLSPTTGRAALPEPSRRRSSATAARSRSGRLLGEACPSVARMKKLSRFSPRRHWSFR